MNPKPTNIDKSQCCNAPVHSNSVTSDGFHYFICNECGDPCDVGNIDKVCPTCKSGGDPEYLIDHTNVITGKFCTDPFHTGTVQPPAEGGFVCGPGLPKPDTQPQLIHCSKCLWEGYGTEALARHTTNFHPTPKSEPADTDSLEEILTDLGREYDRTYGDANMIAEAKAKIEAYILEIIGEDEEIVIGGDLFEERRIGKNELRASQRSRLKEK